MNPRLAARRGDADGDILDCAAETTHRMTFEMRQHNRKIVIQVVLAHEILFQVLAAFYRQGHFAVGIHDVHFRNRRKTVVGSSLEVCLRIGTSATIGRIALHDCAVHFRTSGAMSVGWRKLCPPGSPVESFTATFPSALRPRAS